MRKIALYGIFTGVFLLSACTPAQVTPTTTPTHTPPPIATATITPTETAPPSTSTPKPTTTPTPIISYYDSLPPGEYIIYTFDEPNYHWLVSTDNEGLPHYFVSADGESQGVIIDGLGGRMTPNGKFVIFARDRYGVTRYYRYDIAANTYEDIYLPEYGCREYSFSPDATRVAAACAYNIQIISLTDLTNENLTPWIGNNLADHFSGTAWSFDGQWIAYGYSTSFTESTEEGGIYITNINCLSQPDTCKEQTKGPYRHRLIPSGVVISWAPDGKYLAYTNFYTDNIYCIDIENDEKLSFRDAQKQLLVELEESSSSFAWSPDSTTLAYSQTDGIYIVSREAKQPIRILETDQIPLVEAWITIP